MSLKCLLLQLADETIEIIFSVEHLSARDVCSLSVACSRFNRICSGQNLWQLKCKDRWKIWHSALTVKNHSWKLSYRKRYDAEKRSYSTIHTMARDCYNLEDVSRSDMRGWLDWMEEEDVNYLYAKDTFRELQETHRHHFLTEKHYAIKMNAEMVQWKLTNSFSSLLQLPREQQSLAEGAMLVRQWCTPNEAFDCEEVRSRLTALGNAANNEIVTSQDVAQNPLSATDKILIINRVLFDTNLFSGNVQNYYDVDNSFLDKALKQKTGIPITLSVIYAEVAKQCGLELEPINFPRHFLLRLQVKSPERTLHIDAFDRGKLLTEEQCFGMASAGEFGSSQWLTPATPQDVFVRMGANVMNCYSRIGNISTRSHIQLRYVLQMMVILAPDNLDYKIMLCRINSHYCINLPETIDMLRQLLVDPEQAESHPALITLLRRAELQYKNMLKLKKKFEPKYRSDAANHEVLYRTGMVMHHRRFNYTCVISGWDSFCRMDEDWRTQMGVYHLNNGATQPFYNVLVSDGSNRYASQENLEPMASAVEVTHDEVGRHFSEFNGCCYIPNMSLQRIYPEDNPLPSPPMVAELAGHNNNS